MNFEDQLQELIAKRALELSQQNGSNSSNPADDWLHAEQEIMHELNLRSDKLLKEIGISNEDRVDPYSY